MSAVFRKTLRKIEQVTPLPEGKLNSFLDDVPETTITQFTRHALQKENENKNQPFIITMSDDLASITSHSKKLKPILPWPEALQKYSVLKDGQKDNWEESQIFYPYPLGEFATLAPKEAQREFQLRAQEAVNKW